MISWTTVVVIEIVVWSVQYHGHIYFQQCLANGFIFLNKTQVNFANACFNCIKSCNELCIFYQC